MTHELFGLDAFSPKEIAQRVSEVGVAKARLPLLTLSLLGVLAGAFIGLGALKHKQAMDAVADMSAANEAAKLLR